MKVLLYNTAEKDRETWLPLPTTTGEAGRAMESIGATPRTCKVKDIGDFPTPGIGYLLTGYESLDALNYLAVRLDGMDGAAMEKFAAALEHMRGECEITPGIEEMTALTYNLDKYTFDREAGRVTGTMEGWDPPHRFGVIPKNFRAMPEEKPSVRDSLNAAREAPKPWNPAQRRGRDEEREM